MNAKYLCEKIEQHHGVKVEPGKLTGTLEYFQTWTNLSTPFSHFNELLFVVQNPSAQFKQDWIEI